MSTPAQNIEIVVRDANDNIVDTLVSNVAGVASISLAPGKYKATVAALPQYSFNQGSLVEPGQAPVSLNSLAIIDIDVVAGQETVVNVEYLED